MSKLNANKELRIIDGVPSERFTMWLPSTKLQNFRLECTGTRETMTGVLRDLIDQWLQQRVNK